MDPVLVGRVTGRREGPMRRVQFRGQHSIGPFTVRRFPWEAVTGWVRSRGCRRHAMMASNATGGTHRVVRHVVGLSLPRARPGQEAPIECLRKRLCRPARYPHPV